MRTAFINYLCELAAEDPNIWLVCGDLGFSVLEQFSDRFPDRYLNAGVAEQNMTGLAAGLAMEGKTVFTYSIANFPVMRCLEQIRNDVCYHNLNVKIVAVGGGLAYGSHGYTHHGVEDFAVTCPLPNITVAAPGDPAEAREVARLAASTHGPAYIRLGKAGEPKVHTSPITLEVGRAVPVREGKDLMLVTTGGMLESAMKVSDVLQEKGYSVGVMSMPYLMPFDAQAIVTAATNVRALMTIEEHGRGGLASLTAETLATNGVAIEFHPVRLAAEPIKIAGSQEYLRMLQGMDIPGIERAALHLLT